MVHEACFPCRGWGGLCLKRNAEHFLAAQAAPGVGELTAAWGIDGAVGSVVVHVAVACAEFGAFSFLAFEADADVGAFEQDIALRVGQNPRGFTIGRAGDVDGVISVFQVDFTTLAGRIDQDGVADGIGNGMVGAQSAAGAGIGSVFRS